MWSSFCPELSLLETLVVKCPEHIWSQSNFHSLKDPYCLGRSGAEGPKMRGHLAIGQGTYREAQRQATKVSSGG